MIKNIQPSKRFVPASNYELQRALVNAIIDSSPEGILVVDENGMIVSHNQKFVELWRIPNSTLRGAEPGTAIGANDDPILAHNLSQVKDEKAFLERVKLLYSNPQLQDHCDIELKDGRTLERHSTVLYNDDGMYLGRVWFFRDITLQKQTESNLKELALHDPLTGVSNRRHFMERASQEFARTKRRSAPLAVVVLDVDHFKQINDQNGHAVGDEVLKSLCRIVQGLLRETDVFARLGGEEFTVLLPDTDLDEAAVLAERLRRSIARGKITLSSGELSCTVSVGVSMLRPADNSIEDCLKRGDDAMYKAKQNGRNRIAIED